MQTNCLKALQTRDQGLLCLIMLNVRSACRPAGGSVAVAVQAGGERAGVGGAKPLPAGGDARGAAPLPQVKV